MKPEWRTDTVIQLCLAMRQTQEYSALPILADALQDAGCDDEFMLERLRGTAKSDPWGEVQVALVLDDGAAESLKWLKDFADSKREDSYGNTVNFEEMMSVAKMRTEGKYEWINEQGSQSWEMYGDGEAKEFWKHYQIATGTVVDDDEANIFSCSC